MATKDPRGHYAEIRDIERDLNSLKNDLSKLARHAVEDGSERLQETKSAIGRNALRLGVIGAKRVKEVEGHIRTKPMQSIAVAFVAGAFASLLVRR